MDKYLKKVQKVGSCWSWIGELTSQGYGRLQLPNGKRGSAHRFFYKHFVGEIPSDKELDHLCRNRRCVNPEHLEAVSRGENIRRAWAFKIKNTPNCPNGHPYSGENLYIINDKKNNKSWRGCKKCRYNNVKRSRASRKSANIN